MIFTNSAFIYNHVIDNTNNSISFKEPFDIPNEKVATLNSGAYTINDFASEIARALNEIAAQEYTVTVQRPELLITISATNNFELLGATGATVGVDSFELMGFDQLDYTGSNTYQGQNQSGKIYYPQFKLQSYLDFEDNNQINLSSVNESASGLVEVVSFGDKSFMECNITFITDYEQTKQSIIQENLSGVQDARDFLNYIIRKREIEFIKDINDFNTFEKTILESTPQSSEGTAYRLRELYAKGLVGYYETGLLRFRRIT